MTTSTESCQRRVLVVDDDRDVREAIAEILVDNDMVPEAASDGVEALARLREMPEPPCLILLDMVMPVMDGRAFRTAMLADPLLRDVPIVVFTAHLDAQQSARELQANAWLKKPVGLQTLLDVIGRFCADRAQTRAS